MQHDSASGRLTSVEQLANLARKPNSKHDLVIRSLEGTSSKPMFESLRSWELLLPSLRAKLRQEFGWNPSVSMLMPLEQHLRNVVRGSSNEACSCIHVLSTTNHTVVIH